jgi:hypothetical protein
LTDVETGPSRRGSTAWDEAEMVVMSREVEKTEAYEMGSRGMGGQVLGSGWPR